MKKMVKLSGTDYDSVLCFTGVFIPKNKDLVEKSFILMNSTVHLGAESRGGAWEQKISGAKRYSLIEKTENAIVLRIRYEDAYGCLERVTRDANMLAEQIEALLTALEEE